MDLRFLNLFFFFFLRLFMGISLCPELPFITCDPCGEPHLLQSARVHEHSNDPLITRIHSSLRGVKPPACVCGSAGTCDICTCCVCVREQQCSRLCIWLRTLWPVYCICRLNLTYHDQRYGTLRAALRATRASRCNMCFRNKCFIHFHVRILSVTICFYWD